MVDFVPRHYQDGAYDSVLELTDEGLSSITIMATGTGKTHVFGMLSETFLGRRERVLVLAHNGLLLDQADEKIFSHTGVLPSREQRKFRAPLQAPIVTASVASMQKDRLLRFPPDHFKYIITDEAHRSVAKSYTNIYEHFPDAIRLGFTATADRPDEISLRSVYDRVSYEYPLSTAIKEGFLVPITGRRVKNFSMDLEGMTLRAGDLDPQEIERVIIEHLAPIAENIIQETKGRRKVLVFLPDVKSSELLAETLQGMGAEADYVAGKRSTKANRDALLKFHMSETRFMCSCQKLIEGYDEPGIDCIVMLRPTLSRITYSQSIGRGTRLHPDKTDLLLIEFTFNSSQHKLVSAFELTGGMYDQRIVEEAQRKAETSEEDQDILRLLQETEETFYDINNILARVNPEHLDFVDFDPIGLGDILKTNLHSQTDMWFNDKKMEGPATPKQRDILRRFMITDPGITKPEAAKIISALMEGEIPMYKGPASKPQRNLLETLTGDGVAVNMTKAMAGLLITKKKEENLCKKLEEKSSQQHLSATLMDW